MTWFCSGADLVGPPIAHACTADVKTYAFGGYPQHSASAEAHANG